LSVSVTSSSWRSPAKQPWGIVLIPNPSFTLFSALQDANAYLLMHVTESGILILEILQQFLNAVDEISFTEQGIDTSTL
jgi:hypothetical protein